MTPNEYKQARERSGITNPDIWERAVKVTTDQNKAYAIGRTPVPPDVALRVNKLLERIVREAMQLNLILSDCLPSTVVRFDVETLTITIERDSGKPLVLRNHGLDTMNGWCVFISDGDNPVTFLQVPVKPWGTRESAVRWTIWRGPFQENFNSRRIQNHPNKIDADLLQEVLASAK